MRGQIYHMYRRPLKIYILRDALSVCRKMEKRLQIKLGSILSSEHTWLVDAQMRLVRVPRAGGQCARLTGTAVQQQKLNQRRESLDGTFRAAKEVLLLLPSPSCAHAPCRRSDSRKNPALHSRLLSVRCCRVARDQEPTPDLGRASPQNTTSLPALS